MPVKYVEGDLFVHAPYPEDDITLIVHCCNTIGAWGAGFVIPLCKHYPLAKLSYLKLTERNLGTTDFVTIDNVIVANMIAQDGIGPKLDENDKLIPPIRYVALKECMTQVRDLALSLKSQGKKVRIVCPLFGAGLAGGDWKIIEQFIFSIWSPDPWSDPANSINTTVFYLPQFLPDGWKPHKQNITQIHEDEAS